MKRIWPWTCLPRSWKGWHLDKPAKKKRGRPKGTTKEVMLLRRMNSRSVLYLAVEATVLKQQWSRSRLEAIAAEHGVSLSAVLALRHQVHLHLVEMGSFCETERTLMLASIRALATEARAQDKLGLVLSCYQEVGKLLGLYAPEKHEVATTIHVLPPSLPG